MKNQVQFKHFGTMIDCSRNAVMNVKTLKKWIDLTADLGYNTLCLYMEDTYEVADEPYFGYLRGRYSKEELKEIDEYAKKRGMEVIPCIQTLAHLNQMFRWPKYLPTMIRTIFYSSTTKTFIPLLTGVFKRWRSVFPRKQSISAWTKPL